ncbi:MAG: hypothetical protein U9N77_15805 [Thermodesulfobacteriota bacterium]|nr:hypothetical protein [Thermodesulfobacteriota bacterium]
MIQYDDEQVTINTIKQLITDTHPDYSIAVICPDDQRAKQLESLFVKM